MAVEIRLSKKVLVGVTTADLARSWGITPQAAEKRVNKDGAPKPVARISTLDDQGRITKETKVWTADQWA